MKIDVEGGAALVFEGGKETLRTGPTIYMELHGPDEQAAAGILVRDFGYRLYALDGEAVADPRTRWVSPLAAIRGREG